jgi:RimJ/RimL family protein N-acetyltransferase
MDARLRSAWPLFGLRLRSERLVLRLPSDDQLVELMVLAKEGIHPAGQMPFDVPWSTVPSPEFERGFVQHHWLQRATWTAEHWSLNLLVEHEGEAIGSQSIRGERFAVMRTVDTGSWLGHDFQGRGFGKEMRAAVLGFAFDGLGALAATTEALLDNAASNGVSRSLGYEETGFGSIAPEGVARVTQRFRMTAEGWRSRPRPALAIEGLDGIRDMFGAASSERA